jgi:hypothetical protein
MVAWKIEMHMNCVMEIGVLMCQILNETLRHCGFSYYYITFGGEQKSIIKQQTDYLLTLAE